MTMKDFLMMKNIRKAVNVLSTVALLTSFFPLFFWNRLEGVPIPVHFGAGGIPDRWGNMTSFLILCVIAVLAYAFFMVCQRSPGIMNLLEMSPSRNRPVRPGAIEAAKDMASYLCLVCMLFFSCSGNIGLAVALGKASSMPAWIYLALAAALVLSITVSAVRIVLANSRKSGAE